MRRNTDDPRRSLPPFMPWSSYENRQHERQPTLPGHMHSSMPKSMPYPWMQRPVSGPWTPEMGPLDVWTMPQWNMRMWDIDAEDDSMEMRDMEYWQQLYPEQTRSIQREVSHQCDLLDYEGSVIYDEYPDRIALARICESVYNALLQNGIISNLPSQEFINSNRKNTDDNAYADDNSYDNNSSNDDMADLRKDGQNYDPIGSIDMMQYRHPDYRPSRSLQNLIEVLLYQEMHQRRRKRRRNRRWW